MSSPWWRRWLLVSAIVSLGMPIFQIAAIVIVRPPGIATAAYVAAPVFLYVLMFSVFVVIGRLLLPREVKREWELRKFIHNEKHPPSVSRVGSGLLWVAAIIVGFVLSAILSLKLGPVMLISISLYVAGRVIIGRLRRSESPAI